MTNKNKKHIVIATAIIILVVALLIYRYYIPDMKPKKQSTPASVEYTYDDSVTSSQLAEYKARQDWQLTLVNNDTPICENCSVILTALDNGQAVDCRIYPQLQKMFDDARSQGIYPTITSSFRTAEDQQDILKSKYEHYQKIGYSDKKAKAYAEEWVAMPGTSEHELGLCVDIASGDSRVTNQEVWDWLAKNMPLKSVTQPKSKILPVLFQKNGTTDMLAKRRQRKCMKITSALKNIYRMCHKNEIMYPLFDM